ncbi:MAG: cupin domain-containing protein [Syntrophaceae bacterium]|nr:cupin domain-containing protein [Syntrophaceae bacterium]
MKRDLEIWVFGDHRNHPRDRLTLQVLAKARTLSENTGRVTVVLLGHQMEDIAREYIAYGAQRILMVDHPELAVYRADLFTGMISDLIQEERPDIFLLGASGFGRELAARIAKRIGAGLGADCVSLDWDEQKQMLIASSPAFGGNFLAQICWSSVRPSMATVSPGSFPERPYDKAAHGEIVKVRRDLNQAFSRIRVISSVREPTRSARLEEAKIVVAGGRGMKDLQGFDHIRELSLLLGGEVGATRPAVDAHWTSDEQLIGQTGKSIRPQLLITCGTSGAIQYTAAIRGSGTIVAVNRDPHAPIFKMADFGVVTDALSFLPAFIAEVKGHLFREIADLYRHQVRIGRDQMPVSFGQRIKKLREDRRMSVAEMAEKTGQPPEFIKEVESDSLTPPVSFLLQLSHALQIDPSNFLTEQEKVQIGGKRQEAFVKRTQNYSYRTLTPGAADKHLRSFMVTIEPREKHKMVEYKHPGEEFIFVYKGELELTLGTKVIHLKQGETIHFDSETKHKLRNLSDEKCELIVTLYTP